MKVLAETLQDISICAFLSEAAYLDEKNFYVKVFSEHKFKDYKHYFIEDIKTDTQCHVLVGEFIYVIYRGTEKNLKDVMTDLDITFNDQEIHSGFYKAYISVRDRINRILIEALQEKDRRAFLAGHSLGGALALIHADALPVSVRTQVITFGAPMAFCAESAQFFVKPYIRIEYKLDPVPRLPSDKLGYVYSRGLLLWINLFGDLKLTKPNWADKLSVFKRFHSMRQYEKFFHKIVSQDNFNTDSYIDVD